MKKMFRMVPVVCAAVVLVIPFISGMATTVETTSGQDGSSSFVSGQAGQPNQVGKSGTVKTKILQDAQSWTPQDGTGSQNDAKKGAGKAINASGPNQINSQTQGIITGQTTSQAASMAASIG